MKNYKNINEYIKDAPKERQKVLKSFRALVNELAPGSVEAIRYGMPTIQMGGKNVLHYAVMKSHFGFYPTPSGVKVFERELKKGKIDYSKGCIRFHYDKPIPEALVKKIVRFRVKESKN